MYSEQKYVDTYYMVIHEDFKDVKGNKIDTYYRINDHVWEIDLFEGTYASKRKLKEYADKYIKKIVGEGNFKHYECVEDEYGWTYRAYVYYETGKYMEEDIFEYVQEGEHNVVEEYIVEFYYVEKKYINLNQLS